jgi:hypothetical protein
VIGNEAGTAASRRPRSGLHPTARSSSGTSSWARRRIR